MLRNLSTQAQIIGSNSVSALLFTTRSPRRILMLALKAAPNILSAQVYRRMARPFASYSRDRDRPGPLLPPISPRQTETHWIEMIRSHWYARSCWTGKPIGLSTSDLICRSCIAVSSDTRQSLPSSSRMSVGALLISSVFRRAVC